MKQLFIHVRHLTGLKHQKLTGRKTFLKIVCLRKILPEVTYCIKDPDYYKRATKITPKISHAF